MNTTSLRKKYQIGAFDLSIQEVNPGDILNELLESEDYITGSHPVKGRWENSYLESYLTPSVSRLLNRACVEAKQAYGDQFIVPSQFLAYPNNEYWFNMARPGESTGVHNHKDESTVSGVYYLQVPPDSSDLYFRTVDAVEFSVKSVVGRMILFPSHLDHYVPENRSTEPRISLAFNCYSSQLPDATGNEEYDVHRFFA